MPHGAHNAHNVVGKGKPWKKGQSGNPSGKPKLPALEEILTKTLGTVDEKTGLTEAENVVLAMIKQARKGDVRAAEFLADRAYGKLGIRIDVMAGRLATADLFPDELKFFEGRKEEDDSSPNIRQLQPYKGQEADKSEPQTPD